MGIYRSGNSVDVTRPLSPDEIRALVIGRTRIGQRGYLPDQVDAILARLADETAYRCRQLDQLCAENERIKEALRTWQSNQARTRCTPGSAGNSEPAALPGGCRPYGSDVPVDGARSLLAADQTE